LREQAALYAGHHAPGLEELGRDGGRAVRALGKHAAEGGYLMDRLQRRVLKTITGD
jgi:hypothetical protein